MKKHSFIAVASLAFVLAVSALSWTPVKTSEKVVSAAMGPAGATLTNHELFEQYVNGMYASIGLNKTGLDENVFKKALVGYLNLKHSNQLAKSIITIVDFTKSSTQKRLWIIDLANQKILFNTLVAHGQGSGDDLPSRFSNTSDSHQSSLGFYVTEETYQGKHGLSLKLNGLDEGYNTNARNRAVVMHGAEYVSENFIKTHGRLGRSHGCPALPVELTKTIIDNVKGKSILYINGSDNNYKSNYLNQDTAIEDFVSENSETVPSSSTSTVRATI